LPETLFKVAAYRAKQEAMRSRIRMAMAYPILMAMVGFGTIIFMLTFVMPRLMRIFGDIGQSLPLPTRILIYTSDSLRKWWLPALFVVTMVIVLLKRQSRTEIGKLSLGMVKLHLPVIGKLTMKTELSQFAHTLELLIRSGIPILRAIDVAVPVLGNEVIKRQLKKSCNDLEEGGSFGKSLKNSKMVPPFMANLIIVGEESGKLSEALAEISEAYEQEVDEAMKTYEEQMKNVPPEQRKMMESMMKGRMPQQPPKTVYRKVASGVKVNRWVCDRYDGYLGKEKKEEVWAADPAQFDLRPEDFQVFDDMRDFMEGFSKQSMPFFRIEKGGGKNKFRAA